jgi:hypothetical protein
MDVDTMKTGAVAHLETYVGLRKSAAAELIDAVCKAAQVDMLGLIAGGEPYPTSMSELRVLRLRYMCEAAERMLTTPEVAVLFRMTETAADTLRTRMQAAYPNAVARYLDELVRTSAHYQESGDPKAGMTYLIRFDQLPAWAHAVHKLREVGCSDIREDSSKRSIEPPRTFKNAKGEELNVLAVLGIPEKTK